MQPTGLTKLNGETMKKIPEENKGLKKLPKEVRNKMGYMAKGGLVKTGNMDRRVQGMFYSSKSPRGYK